MVARSESFLVSATTDGNGYAIISHGLAAVPNTVHVTPSWPISGNGIFSAVTVDSLTAKTFRIRAFQPAGPGLVNAKVSMFYTAMTTLPVGPVPVPVPTPTPTPVPTPTPTPVPTPSGHGTLVWSDEFDGQPGAAPDGSKWITQTGNITGDQNYVNSTANLSLDGASCLKVTATKSGSGYNSGRLNSKFNMKYGYVEARISFPSTPSVWPAAWAMGVNSTEYGGTAEWPNCGEIDFAEAIDLCTTNYTTIHTGPPGGPDINSGDGLSAGTKSISPAKSWHTYGFSWNATSITWYLDGIQTGTLSKSAFKPWVFDQNMYILLNVAVGGGWAQEPGGSSVYPATMYVDYVRFYQ